MCDLVAGRATLAIELKSRFDGDRRLAQRTAEVLATYAGPVAVMSFDPAMVERLRAAAPGLPRGIVAERRYRHAEWDALPAAVKRRMAAFTHALRTQPHFIAYAVRDLPAAVPLIARHVLGMPLLTWTVRTPTDLARARAWADQIIFEGFRP
jgi:glycerophosphoryl diester phosphodiesterase